MKLTEQQMNGLVDRFLACELDDRWIITTNEARAMLEHVLAPLQATQPEESAGMVSIPAYKLLAIRDCLVAEDSKGAYHELYNSITWNDSFKPWAEWEANEVSAGLGSTNYGVTT